MTATELKEKLSKVDGNITAIKEMLHVAEETREHLMMELQALEDDRPDPKDLGGVPGESVLTEGTRGDPVRALQTILNDKFGAGLDTDGEFGPQTKHAVMDAQRKLTPSRVDGVARKDFFEKLQAANLIDLVTKAAPTPLKFIDRYTMVTHGRFNKGGPSGLLVHFTAGHSKDGDQNAIAAIDMNAHQYAYWAMSSTGTIVRGHPLDRWGYHAGASEYPGLGKGVSSSLLGLEICNAGLLDRTGKSWFGVQYTAAETRNITKPRYKRETSGLYHCYTEVQEAMLMELIMWLCERVPHFNIDYVLGHDEVITPAFRKNDPGGALSMGMPQLRVLARAEAKRRGLR